MRLSVCPTIQFNCGLLPIAGAPRPGGEVRR